jgi:dihydropteroate synthase
MSGNPRVIIINNLQLAREELAKIGPGENGAKIMANKAVFYTLKVEGIPGKAANIIKLEMLSKGGEAAVSRAALIHPHDPADVLIMGTIKQYKLLAVKLKMQPFGLAKLAEELLAVINNLQGFQSYELKCSPYSLTLGRRTLVMGILNVTPDSFTDGGKFYDLDLAVEQAKQMVLDGADLIDVGGESTRPTATPLDVISELSRVLPVVEKLAKEIKVPISIDTYKATVARQAIAMGAGIVNDIWGLRQDPDMAKTVAELGVPYIMMHNQQGTEYRDLMGDILAFFREGIALAEAAGIKPENIILDPGIGFGKTYQQNLEVMHRLGELRSLGKPILLGTSRKSVIGNTLNLPVDERVEGTSATVALGIAHGADIVRVHDTKELVRVVRMTDAIVRWQHREE